MESREQLILRWLSILYRYGHSYLARRMEECNIGSGQYGILLALYRDGTVTQVQLSDYLKIDKGSIAKSVKKLEEEGYVEKEVDETDRRAFKVSLTPKGHQIIPLLRQACDDWEDFMTAEFNEFEKKQVEQLLHKMTMKVHCLKESY